MSNLKVVVPSVTWSPDLSLVEPTRRPLTLIPLVEPRSAIVHSPLLERRSSAWWRETLGSRRTQSASRERAIVDGDDRPGRHLGAPGRGCVRRRCVAHGRVDHRVPLLALAGSLALVRRRLDQPRLDPELAEA